MSPRLWEVLGVDPDAKQHLASEWQDLIHPDDLQLALENFERHCADPDHPYDQIVRYTHADGSTVWVRCRGVAIRDSEGRPIRMLGAHNEIPRSSAPKRRWRRRATSWRSGRKNVPPS
ncbi:MAG: PAS domain-containing protein [Myxococcota bacterium]|nr:PAS domain-containing protein [Myxococcota bacterium]